MSFCESLRQLADRFRETANTMLVSSLLLSSSSLLPFYFIVNRPVTGNQHKLFF
jgi:hypothetical protein